MRPSERKVHGTYPWDDAWGSWKRISPLTVDEAARLLGIPESERERRACYSCHGDKFIARGVYQTHCPCCDGTGLDDEYLFLNKGYIVISPDAPKPGTPDLHLALCEQCTTSGVQVRGILPGMRAVYLHDGEYTLIEKQDPYRTQREELLLRIIEAQEKWPDDVPMLQEKLERLKKTGRPVL